MPASEKLNLGKDDFSISIWVKCAGTPGDIVGDVLSKFDLATRTGLNFTISASSSGYSSNCDTRNVQIGIDSNTEGKWEDCGRPSPTNTSVPNMVVYNGDLYVGIAGSIDSNETCKIFRYAGGGKWIDCGRAGDISSAISVQSMIVHKGDLYVGTGIWDWIRNHCKYQTETHVYKYLGGTSWLDCGQAGNATRLSALASYSEDLYSAPLM